MVSNVKKPAMVAAFLFLLAGWLAAPYVVFALVQEQNLRGTNDLVVQEQNLRERDGAAVAPPTGPVKEFIMTDEEAAAFQKMYEVKVGLQRRGFNSTEVDVMQKIVELTGGDVAYAKQLYEEGHVHAVISLDWNKDDTLDRGECPCLKDISGGRDSMALGDFLFAVVVMPEGSSSMNTFLEVTPIGGYDEEALEKVPTYTVTGTRESAYVKPTSSDMAWERQQARAQWAIENPVSKEEKPAARRTARKYPTRKDVLQALDRPDEMQRVKEVRVEMQPLEMQPVDEMDVAAGRTSWAGRLFRRCFCRGRRGAREVATPLLGR
ncbi:unnamed protein product [Amoebophrya sp. A120]|nr:unnamed protein product [Amoebophrya sp. A120]|eukprot:GSA120T00001512001.1